MAPSPFAQNLRNVKLKTLTPTHSAGVFYLYGFLGLLLETDFCKFQEVIVYKVKVCLVSVNWDATLLLGSNNIAIRLVLYHHNGLPKDKLSIGARQAM